MKITERVRSTLRGALGRHEARMAARPANRAACWALAGFVDLAAMVTLVVTILRLEQPEPVEVVVAFALLAILLAIPLVWSVGLMIPAMAGEKADGTLESLMLTPVSRRELLWAKLLGRMQPVRLFMRASLPAFAMSWEVLLLRLGATAVEAETTAAGGAAVLGLFTALALLAAGLYWGLLVLDVHCAAAITLYCSARTSTPVRASLLAYLTVFGPPIVLGCCYGVGLPFHFVAGPIMFTELVRNLDRFTIETE